MRARRAPGRRVHASPGHAHLHGSQIILGHEQTTGTPAFEMKRPLVFCLNR
jgi:hypothetical protein